jgi:hypothetical protein
LLEFFLLLVIGGVLADSLIIDIFFDIAVVDVLKRRVE